MTALASLTVFAGLLLVIATARALWADDGDRGRAHARRATAPDPADVVRDYIRAVHGPDANIGPHAAALLHHAQGAILRGDPAIIVTENDFIATGTLGAAHAETLLRKAVERAETLSAAERATVRARLDALLDLPASNDHKDTP